MYNVIRQINIISYKIKIIFMKIRKGHTEVQILHIRIIIMCICDINNSYTNKQEITN